MNRTSDLETISTKQRRIAELASAAPEMALRTLGHHIDIDWLKEAYRRTRKDGAPGIDGQSAEAYAQDLEGNLGRLLEAAKSGSYRAPPVRRTQIPKGDGTTRPIGVPTFEDKVLQRAVVMVMEPIYEQDFLPCSYGFRPGRSAHQGLEALWKQTMEMGGGWVLEVDIRSYFDTIAHGPLRERVQRRVRDGVRLRLIGKWLQAGVMEGHQVLHPEMGCPQGGVISPLLANIYLHEVLDTWFEEQVRPRMRGRACMVRYADDAVLVFEAEADARRVMAVLPKRMEKYGLKLHPDKTRLVPFGRPRPGGPKSGTFDLLGFSHYWGRSRRGNWVIQRKTARGRLARALGRVAEYCRRRRHDPLSEQQEQLRKKLQGHYGYYGITGNGRTLSEFRYQVSRIWQHWLSRRSQKAKIRWDRFNRLLRLFPLPPAIVVHSIYRAARL